MRDINKIIAELYGAYNKKDISAMKILIDEAKTIDPNNSYLQKYEGLYNSLNNKNNPEQGTENKVVKFGGKTIKCTHCGSNLSFSENNKKVIEDYKAGITKELKFKCTYCNTEFIWSDKGINPLYLNIGVGQEINVEGKKYKISGGIKYIGTWQTKNSGKLEYIERILIDDSGDTYYLSESKAYWQEDGESGIEYQTEISRKIIPDFSIGGLNESQIIINNSSYSVTEICNVRAMEAYGENSKSYTIGEEITTFQLSYKGYDYVFEKEKTKSQQEIGIYHTWEINDKNLRGGNIGYDNSYQKGGTNFKGILMFLGIILSFFISFGIFSSEKTIKQVSLNDLVNEKLSDAKGLYKINFSDEYKKDYLDLKTTYDYGGIKHNIKFIEGLKFKVETEEDLEILKKILSGEIKIDSVKIQNQELFFTKLFDIKSEEQIKSFSSYFTGNTIVKFK